jgi:hypothetical protein
MKSFGYGLAPEIFKFSMRLSPSFTHQEAPRTLPDSTSDIARARGQMRNRTIPPTPALLKLRMWDIAAPCSKGCVACR